ncbi:uncharacterized protein K452DRAFT_194758, partial [Aplosporella prunicola CBS 121167]
WIMEALSILIATLCLCAIVITLAIFENHTLLDWPFAITINSLIAVFTAVFKGSQFKWTWYKQPHFLVDIERFDMASRGPWGCVKLLASRIPGYNTPWLASVGALVTVATLAVDPFSQQIVQQYSCMRIDPVAEAMIPRANKYSKAGLTYNEVDYDIDGQMSVAIYMGLLNPPKDSAASITARCLTNNCTFPEIRGSTFSTLAMCGFCANSTDKIINETTETPRYSLPSTASTERQVIEDSIVFSSKSQYKSGNRSSQLYTFDSLMWRCKEEGSCYTRETWEPFALTCSLNPCLKTFRANTSHGAYEEEEISSENLSECLYEQPAGYLIVAKDTIRDGAWKSCDPSVIKTEDYFIPIDTTKNRWLGPFSNDRGQQLMWFTQDCVYRFDPLAVRAIHPFLNGLFNDKSLDSHVNQSNYLSALPALSHQLPLSQATGDMWLKNFYRNGTLTTETANKYMEALANSMTGVIRQQPNDTEDMRFVKGKTWRTQTCIRVRWPWLSFPVALLGLGILFTMGIELTTRRGTWRRDWKSSPLALLFHGLDEKTRRKKGELKRKDDMYAASKEIKVRLRKVDEGWRFV